MIKIEFIKDFANKKAGETFECDLSLASQLVRQEKVAIYFETKKVAKSK